MPPALQILDWDFVSDVGLHWEVRGTVLLFPGREEGLMRALVLVGEGREVNGNVYFLAFHLKNKFT